MSIATTDNSSFLSHCHGFSIYGGTFNHYTAQASSASSTDRDSSGLPIISDDEILPVRQLRQWATYSLHSAEARGTAVVVKVFHGARANRDWHATSAFSRKLIHPSFLRLLGRSTDDSPTRFLVYNSVQGTAQNHLASVLKGSLRECIRVGVDMVHGLSLGLIYLTLHKFPVPCLHAEAFDILVSHTGSIVLGIQSETSISEARSELDEGGWVELLNLLCRKTFNQAGHALYHDTVERDALSTPLPHLDISCLSSQELPDTSESPYLRRELIWRPPPPSTSSLTDIIHQTEFFLSRLSSSTAPPIPQYQSTVRSDSAHRCTGYHREDVVISSHIRNSYIVHSQAPSLQEICTICDERVEESGHFTCDCGVDDDGFSATVKCGACYAWHHARCVQPIPAGLNLGSQRCTLRSPASELGGQAPQAGAPSVSPSTPSFGQNTVSKVLPADNPDDATDLKPGVSKYQESRLRDRDVQMEQLERLQEAPKLSRELRELLAEVMGRLTAGPRYTAVPLLLPPAPKDKPAKRTENPAIAPKPRSSLAGTLLDRRDPQPEMHIGSFLDDLSTTGSGAFFEQPTGLDLSPLPGMKISATGEVVGPMWEPDVNYYEPQCSKRPAWFDMAY